MFSLRPYQAECLREIHRNAGNGVRRQLVVLPTGSGKTVIFAQIPQSTPGKKTLVLAHREELLTQAAAKIRKSNPDLHIAIEQASIHASRRADVVVASVPTIGRPNSKRLIKLDPADFGTVICDEAHHSVALSYRHILNHFGILEGAAGAPL